MPRIEPTISVGSLIAACTALLGAVGAVVAVTLFIGRMEARISRVEDRALQTSTDLVTLRQERAANVQATAARIEALERNWTGETVRLNGIVAAVQELKDQQRETNALLRQLLTVQRAEDRP